jgi:hypothetical protein
VYQECTTLFGKLAAHVSHMVAANDENFPDAQFSHATVPNVDLNLPASH